MNHYSLYRELMNQQSKSRSGNPPKMRTNNFIQNGNNIFDVSHAEAMNSDSLDETRKRFLSKTKIHFTGTIGEISGRKNHNEKELFRMTKGQ